jgi:hypothetical protein
MMNTLMTATTWSVAKPSRATKSGGHHGRRMESIVAGSVNDIPDSELLRRAVTDCRANVPKGRPHPRWVAVMETFALGSGYSRELCERFDLAPDELVRRT